MDEQVYGSGFKVFIDRCHHKTTFEISSYESARVVANPNGALTLECSDVALLSGAAIPSKSLFGMLGALLGAGDPSDLAHEGPDQTDEQILLFPDEVSLELWLGTEFLPGLNLFGDEDDRISSEASEEIGRLTKSIMVDVLGNKARNQVRRDFG